MVKLPRLSPYPFSLHSPCPGALCLAELHLRGHPVILLNCLWAQTPRGSGLERSLAKVFDKYPYHVLGGNFNAQLSLLTSDGVTRNNWSWLTTNWAADTFRATQRTISAFTS